jgi:hypothetical protein
MLSWAPAGRSLDRQNSASRAALSEKCLSNQLQAVVFSLVPWLAAGARDACLSQLLLILMACPYEYVLHHLPSLLLLKTVLKLLQYARSKIVLRRQTVPLHPHPPARTDPEVSSGRKPTVLKFGIKTCRLQRWQQFIIGQPKPAPGLVLFCLPSIGAFLSGPSPGCFSLDAHFHGLQISKALA